MKILPSKSNWRTVLPRAARVSLWLAAVPLLVAQEVPTRSANASVAAPASAPARTVLFIGNSFTFGGSKGLDFHVQEKAELIGRPRGKNERSACELGFSPAQASALHQVAFDELMAAKGRSALKPFSPKALPR